MDNLEEIIKRVLLGKLDEETNEELVVEEEGDKLSDDQQKKIARDLYKKYGY